VAKSRCCKRGGKILPITSEKPVRGKKIPQFFQLVGKEGGRVGYHKPQISGRLSNSKKQKRAGKETRRDKKRANVGPQKKKRKPPPYERRRNHPVPSHPLFKGGGEKVAGRKKKVREDREKKRAAFFQNKLNTTGIREKGGGKGDLLNGGKGRGREGDVIWGEKGRKFPRARRKNWNAFDFWSYFFGKWGGGEGEFPIAKGRTRKGKKGGGSSLIWGRKGKVEVVTVQRSGLCRGGWGSWVFVEWGGEGGGGGWGVCGGGCRSVSYVWVAGIGARKKEGKKMNILKGTGRGKGKGGRADGSFL